MHLLAGITNDSEALEDLDRALDKGDLVARDIVLFAERLDKGLDLVEIVAGKQREEVVVDLEAKAASEP